MSTGWNCFQCEALAHSWPGCAALLLGASADANEVLNDVKDKGINQFAFAYIASLASGGRPSRQADFADVGI